MSKKKGTGGKKPAEDDDWDAILQEEIAKNSVAMPAPQVVEQAPLQPETTASAAKDEDSGSEEEGDGAPDSAKKVRMSSTCQRTGINSIL